MGWTEENDDDGKGNIDLAIRVACDVLLGTRKTERSIGRGLIIDVGGISMCCELHASPKILTLLCRACQLFSKSRNPSAGHLITS